MMKVVFIALLLLPALAFAIRADPATGETVLHPTTNGDKAKGETVLASGTNTGACCAASPCAAAQPKCPSHPEYQAAAPAAPAAPATTEKAMHPAKILHANEGQCGCCHQETCACGCQEFVTPEIKEAPCACHAEPSCPCAAAAAEPAHTESACCKAADTCHPSVPKCATVEPEMGAAHVAPEIVAHKEACACHAEQHCPCAGTLAANQQ